MGKDKLLHFFMCFIATATIGFFSILGGILFSTGLGVGKEYGDSKAAGNRWDWWDILADAMGMVAGLVLSILTRRWM